MATAKKPKPEKKPSQVGLLDGLGKLGQVYELVAENNRILKDLVFEVKTLRSETREGFAQVKKQLKETHMKLSDLSGSLNQVGDQLEKAQAEILDALEKLAASDPDISPEGQAAIDRLKSAAQRLDDIIPDNVQAPPEGETRRMGRDPEQQRAERTQAAQQERNKGDKEAKESQKKG